MLDVNNILPIHFIFIGYKKSECILDGVNRECLPYRHLEALTRFVSNRNFLGLYNEYSIKHVYCIYNLTFVSFVNESRSEYKVFRFDYLRYILIVSIKLFFNYEMEITRYEVI